MTAFAGAHVVITGGSEGIGLETARLALARGASVSIVSRSAEKLAAANDSLGGRAATAAADVTDATALGRALALLSPCDVLIACAGAAEPGRFEQLDDATFRAQMELNYFGTLNAVRVVTPSMRERGRGHIVLVASTAALIGVFGYSAYAPTKFAVRGLAETLHGELTAHGIVVSIVYPPDTETPGFARENLTKPPETAAISAAIKPVPPERVAAAIVRGIERDRLEITADPQTRVLLRAGGLVTPLVRRSMARAVRRSRRRGNA